MSNKMFFDYDDNIDYGQSTIESHLDSITLALNNKCKELNFQIHKLETIIGDLQNVVDDQKQLLNKCVMYISKPWYKRILKFKL